MGPTIKKLKRDVTLKLRSQVFITSIPSAVNELVQNSVDAGATDINVTIDLATLSFVVADNGKGIHPDDLPLLGSQYCTSKLDTLREIQDASTYGFRGEALHSIAKVSHVVVITKTKAYNATWRKVLDSGDSICMVESKENFFGIDVTPYSRDSSGCTVIVSNLMYNLPVRRKFLLTEPHHRIFNEIKRDIFQILVADPTVKISVSLKISGGEYKKLLESPGIFHMKKSEVLVQLLRTVFGSIVPSNTLKSISLSFKEISINGIISKYPVRIKNIQFIYINGRRYEDVGFLRTIDTLFKSVGFGYSGQVITNIKSVGTPHRFYPLFVIDIVSPQSISDLLQSTSKVIVHPTLQAVINPLIMKALNSFLALQGYTTPNRWLSGSSSASSGPYKGSAEVFTGQSIPDITSCEKNTPLIRTRLHQSKIRVAKLTNSEILGRFDASQHQVAPKPTFKPPSFGTKCGATPSINNRNSRLGNWLDIPNPRYTRIGNCLHLNGKYANKDINIERSQLHFCSVISQLDNKFILLKVPQVEGADGNDSMKLFILDQHACDERIKLESYLHDFVYSVLTNSTLPQPIVEELIDITATETYLFKHYSEEMKKWGILYNIKENVDGNFLLTIEALPDILLEKYKKDKTFLKDALLQHFTELEMHIRNPLPNFKTPRERSPHTAWWKYLGSIPVMIREVFNSKACRSAIMFGDTLTVAECNILVKKLSSCHDPFHCAHGRPSVVPLTELKTPQGDDHPYIQHAIDYVV